MKECFMRHCLITLSVAALCAGLAGSALAQSRTAMGGSSSMGGLGGGISSLGGGGGFGGMGGSSMGIGGGSSMGIGGGSSSFGMGTSGGFGGGSNANPLGSGFGGSSFMNNSRQAGSFVGTTAAQAQSVLGSVGGSMAGTNGLAGGMNGMRGLTGMNGMGGMGGMRSGQMGGNMLNNQNQMGMGMNGMVPFRAALVPALDRPTPTVAPTLGGDLTHRLQTTPGLKVHLPLSATVEGQTVVLRGQVASDHDRLLAEQLARLEPGVWQVKNELVVKGAAGPTGSHDYLPSSSPPEQKPAASRP